MASTASEISSVQSRVVGVSRRVGGLGWSRRSSNSILSGFHIILEFLSTSVAHMSH